MRALVLGSSSALVALVMACSLTTDLTGLADGPRPGDEGGVDAAPADALARLDASAPDGSPGAVYASVVLADTPVAYYRFEDAVGASSAKDEIGEHPALLTTPGVTFGSAGASGHGVTLDGTTSLDVGNVFSFAGKQPYSLETWVATAGRNRDQRLITKRDDLGDPIRGYIFYLGSDRTPHYEGWGVDLSAWSDTPIPTTRFVHVVATISYETGKGNATMFVDGDPATHGGFDNVADLPATTVHLLLGEELQGTLDELAVYDKALSPDRILAHYRAGRP